MDKKIIRNIASIVILFILFVLSFFILKPILLSIITGILFASLFTSLFVKMNKKIKSRDLCAGIIISLFLILIIVPLWFLIPEMLNQSIKIYSIVQNTDFVTPLRTLMPSIFSSVEFSNEIGSTIQSFAINLSNSLSNSISKLVLNFPTLFLHLLVVFFTFFFVVRDHDKLISYIQSILPFSKEVEQKIFKSTKDITISILYGQIILGIVQGLILGIAFLLFGVNNALLLTILACIAGIFPIIGTTIVWIPVSIFLMVNGNYVPGIGVMFFGFVCSFLENVTKPAFVSKRTNIHSVVILLGMVGGLYFFGILGFILGPLFLAYLLIILDTFRDKRTPSLLIQGEVLEKEEK